MTRYTFFKNKMFRFTIIFKIYSMQAILFQSEKNAMLSYRYFSHPKTNHECTYASMVSTIFTLLQIALAAWSRLKTLASKLIQQLFHAKYLLTRRSIKAASNSLIPSKSTEFGMSTDKSFCGSK